MRGRMKKNRMERVRGRRGEKIEESKYGRERGERKKRGVDRRRIRMEEKEVGGRGRRLDGEEEW